jgi:hypothetical protein
VQCMSALCTVSGLLQLQEVAAQGPVLEELGFVMHGCAA